MHFIIDTGLNEGIEMAICLNEEVNLSPLLPQILSIVIEEVV